MAARARPRIRTGTPRRTPRFELGTSACSARRACVPREGLEPPPIRLEGGCSSSELPRQMVPPPGFEPGTLRLKVGGSDRLSYGGVVPRRGIEPRLSGPKPGVLPIDERGLRGGDGGRTRTPRQGHSAFKAAAVAICRLAPPWRVCRESNPALRLRRPPSYPMDHRRMEPLPGFEPGTCRLQGGDSDR